MSNIVAFGTVTIGALFLVEVSAWDQVVPSSIDRKWKQLPQIGVNMGKPLGAERQTSGGRSRRFEHGLIYSSPEGTFFVYGNIAKKWFELGAEARLGWPVSDEEPQGSGRISRFQHGVIYWNQQHGAVAFELLRERHSPSDVLNAIPLPAASSGSQWRVPQDGDGKSDNVIANVPPDSQKAQADVLYEILKSFWSKASMDELDQKEWGLNWARKVRYRIDLIVHELRNPPKPK